MITIPILTTERLTLRAPTAADLPALTEFYASDRSKFVGGPMNAEQTWRTLAAEIGHWGLRGYGRWSVEITETGAFAGIIGLWCPEGWPEPELGWDLMENATGKGYGTEAALAARAYAYDTLGWTTLISLIKEENTPSAALATRIGCVKDGNFTHERHGYLNIYRHPASKDLT